MAIMMSAQGVGNAASFLGESENAIKAGAAIVAIRDRPLPIDAFADEGERPATVEGRIEFRDINIPLPDASRGDGAPTLQPHDRSW
ncbi:hypothetical protein PINS_up016315 [Pythium insidiosum]|nr:hypothetical protein PINS_up016315 [Pythium insidiosum]